MSTADRPIGVFDSGIGGLTVVRRLVEELPNESIVYFGDTARVPYGNKSADTVRRYSHEAAAFLLSHDIKLLVIACNTATAHAEQALRDSLPIPVVGVIEPGARAAVRTTRSGRIGVVGTAGTISSGAYDMAVRRQLPDARVYAQPCPLFVPLVEEGWVSHPTARLVALEYLQPLVEMDVDSLILGCTHYPLMSELIAEIMGDGVTLVDSADEAARDVHQLIRERGLARTASTAPRYTFFASDSPLRFRDVSRRLVGDLITTVERVDVEGHGRAA
jgi:glutamate racemase